LLVTLAVTSCGDSNEPSPASQARTQPADTTPRNRDDRTPLERAAAALATACLHGESRAKIEQLADRFGRAAKSAPESRVNANLIAVARANLRDGCGPSLANRIPRQPSPPKPTKPTPAEPEPARKGSGFTGELADRYDEAKVVCGSSPPAKVARDLGISVNVHTSEGIVRIAERYARGYDARHHQAAFEGCLDGLPNPR
jgi:hypothetical protein